VIERARKLLGKDDLFADKQIIAMYRENGRRQDALLAVRALRNRFPKDYGLLRLEASILTESGVVDQGVTLIRNLMEAKPVSGVGNGNASVPPLPAVYDDFTNYLFISHLYNEANRGSDARLAADQAYNAAGSDDRRQLARLTIATSQRVSGDYAAAESTLREILLQTPGNPIALNNLGYVLVEKNERLSEALILIQKAIRIDPTNPSYLDSLGWANFRLGNLEEAERNLRNAARMDYASETIQEHLGDVYNKQGKQEQARSFWQRALDLATNESDAGRIRMKLRQ
jgi:predicted Zn-dependent protease